MQAQTEQQMPPMQVSKESASAVGSAREKLPTQGQQKDRAWQDELLGAFLPQAQATTQQAQAAPDEAHTQQQQEQTQTQTVQAVATSRAAKEAVKSKVIVLLNQDESVKVEEARLITILQASIFVTIFTGFLLWFFEPSFVQSHHQIYSISADSDKNGNVKEEGDYIYTSSLKIFIWSILAGVFAFTLLYSMP